MPVDYRKEGRVAVITLDRPDAMNAIDPEMADGIDRALVEFAGDDKIWTAVVTGAGSAFSVGADVATTLPGLKHRAGKYVDPFSRLVEMDCWKPMVAAVNGAALGGGLELALLCDIRIAAETSMFGFPEVTLGLIPGWGGTQRITRAVPLAIAAELLLLGRPISVARALQAGLVNKVVPRSELMAAAMNTAEALCRVAPLAVRAARQSMLRGRDRSLEAGLELERSLTLGLAATDDFDEGCKAFLEKRKPVFKGS